MTVVRLAVLALVASLAPLAASAAACEAPAHREFDFRLGE